jgi:ribosomal-protein-alanine N-acetyltransferase
MNLNSKQTTGYFRPAMRDFIKMRSLALHSVHHRDISSIIALLSASKKFHGPQKITHHKIKTDLHRAGRDLRSKDATEYRWCISLRGYLIGTFVVRNINWQEGTGEIGYGIFPEYQGQGLATPAAQAALLYIFRESNLQKIYAYVDCENSRSIRVLENVGFKSTRCIRNFKDSRKILKFEIESSLKLSPLKAS